MTQAFHHRPAKRGADGFSLTELVVAIAVIAAMAAMGVPRLQDFFADQHLRAAARDAADALRLARVEAIRTGNPHIVFLSPGSPPAGDPAGTPLGVDPATGGQFPIIVTDDGPRATSNCRIDANEIQDEVHGEADVAWGVTVSGGLKSPDDIGAGLSASGSTFASPAGVGTTWVMFNPDGVPVGFDAACNRGAVGSGGGGIYLTNGRRDYAVVLSPLGSVRVHGWDAGANAWTN